MDIPYAELDALYHGPNWTKRPTFEDDLDRFTSQPAWITEWQYDEARPLLLDRADTFIWLDLPFPLVLWRVTSRTACRWITREELWAGNREQPLWKIFTDRSNIIRWSIASRHVVRDQMPTIRTAHPTLRILRLRRRKHLEQFLTRLER